MSYTETKMKKTIILKEYVININAKRNILNRLLDKVKEIVIPNDSDLYFGTNKVKQVIREWINDLNSKQQLIKDIKHNKKSMNDLNKELKRRLEK